MPLNIDLGPHLEVRWKSAPLRVRREILAELQEIYRFLEDDSDDIPMLAPVPQAAVAAAAAAPSRQAKPALAQTSLFDAPPPPPATPAKAPESSDKVDLTPRSDNPFLPKSVLAKLQDSQAQASAQLRELMHSQENPPSVNAQRLEQELRLKLGPVIETLIEEHMQGLKSELRFRMRAEMDRLIAASVKKDA